jgi:hypothetical protein
VRLEGREERVRGYASPPFFAFRGTAAGYNRMSNQFTLTRQADGEIVATLATYAQCRALASELATVLLRGDPPPPEGIVERHKREAK